ncbi:selenocysteine synthase [Pasteurellaceae bacterium Macca]|nr:selenocysteine synthase [Pasteurellaceae bacterium Macca]
MNKIIDPLYFDRKLLANALLTNLASGISHALTLFAPRRMGKTQFLLNDITPQANAEGFNVFYFSFMDSYDGDLKTSFCQALISFIGAIQSEKKALSLLDKVASVEIMGFGVELNGDKKQNIVNPSHLINEIARLSKKPVLLLLDEIQELARVKETDSFIRSLRTGLDINQRKVKVIFTGSSTNGLRAMFNDNKAPFFHFAHAIDFPNLGQEFSDFLANIYQQRTGNEIDKQAFFTLFQRLNYTPLYLRAITQDMIINPALTLEQAAQIRLAQIGEQAESSTKWQQISELERQLLIIIAQQGNISIYSAQTRKHLANTLGVENLTPSSIQGKIRKLERADLITRNADNSLKINDPYFQTWINENADNHSP